MTEPPLTELHQKIDAGVKVAVAEAIERHRRLGQSISFLKDGQVAFVTPMVGARCLSGGEVTDKTALKTLFLRLALSIFSRRRSVGTKIFFTAIAKPNPQHLRNLVFLLFG